MFQHDEFHLWQCERRLGACDTTVTLRAEDRPLPDWHYLVSGDRDAVHRAGESIVGWTVSEDVAGPLENHLVERIV